MKLYITPVHRKCESSTGNTHMCEQGRSQAYSEISLNFFSLDYLYNHCMRLEVHLQKDE